MPENAAVVGGFRALHWKRFSKPMPVYKYSKGKWRVRIYHHGDRQDWIVEGSKKEAEAFEARTRVALEGSALPERRTVPTFLDFCVKEYRHHAQAHLKTRTWQNRQYQLRTLIEHFGSLKLNELGVSEVEAYKHKRLAAGVQPSTINDDLKVLRAVLGYAHDLDLPVRIPRMRRLPVRKGSTAQFWTRTQVTQLYESVAALSPDLLPVVVFLLNTGCRRGEAIALEWKHVDLDRRLVKIWPSEEWQPKDGDPREIPFGATLYEWLTKPAASNRWVFPCPATNERYAYWPQRKFDRARKAAGLIGGPHTTRHTFAAHFLSTQPDLYLLSQLMGHSYERVTALYAHLLPDHLERARGAVDLTPKIHAREWVARRNKGDV